MVSRAEIDMLDIRECFRLRYEKSLYNMIQVPIHKQNRIQTFLDSANTFICVTFIYYNLKSLPIVVEVFLYDLRIAIVYVKIVLHIKCGLFMCWTCKQCT